MYRRIFWGEGEPGAGGSPFRFLRQVFFPKNRTKKIIEDPLLLMRRRRRKLALAGLAVAFLAVFVVAVPASAEGFIDTFVNIVMGLLTSLVLVLCEILGFFILILVDFLVSITQYNNFVKAYPVSVGWPIMRDTVNMFFIIVVLVSAFSTIVGYKDFHYKSVLPKLLLMAVLINFSKTLIGLMIDFSQVIVLTFVNGFKQIAGNNFIQALQIGNIMKLNEGGDQVVKEEGGKIVIGWSDVSEVTPLTMVSIFAASVFALWIMSISMTLLIIMIIFFLARIIVLWMLLITSPVMFFAWALPGKMQKAFSAFASDWWKRLSSALVGGPIMAFFLWLALAMAQDNGTVSSLYSPSKSSETTQASATGKNVVITKIGAPDKLAQFIVMIAFMLMGVQTAVSMAREAVPQIGGLVGKVGEAGGMFGAGAALGAITARYGGAAVGKGAMAVERQTGIGAKLAGKMAVSGMPMTMGMRTGLAKFSTIHRREAEEKQAEYKKAIGMMAPEDQKAMIKKIRGSALSTKAEVYAANNMETELVTNTPYQKQRQKNLRSQMDDSKSDLGKKFGSLSDAEKDATARHLVNEEIAQDLARLEDDAVKSNNTDLVKKINDAREKNPAHFRDAKAGPAAGVDKKRDMASKLASDPQAINTMQDDAFQDATVAFNFMHSKGWIDERGRLKVGVKDDDQYKNFMRGKQASLVTGHLEYARKSAANGDRVQRLINGTATDADNYTLQTSKDKKSWVAADALGSVDSGRFDRSTDDAAVVLRNASATAKADIVAHQGVLGTGADAGVIGRELPTDVATDYGVELKALGTRGTPVTDADRAKLGTKFISHVSSKAIFGLDAKTGTFSDPSGQAGHQQMLAELSKQVRDEAKAGTLTTETASKLSSAISQAGTEGESFKQVAQTMINMNAARPDGRQDILSFLKTGNEDVKKQSVAALRNIVSRAQLDDDNGMKNSEFQQARDVLIKTDTTNKDTRELSDKLQHLLT